MQQLKNLSLWTEEDVLNLPSSEFDWLEFKSSAKFCAPNFENDLSKYLSAWSNYGGGYLIFGVTDPKPGSVLQIDGGVQLALKKDMPTWIDQLLPNLVEPKLPIFTTHFISRKGTGSKIKPDHAIIVVHVPQSESAPHQAQDRKYYQRLGRNLEPLRHQAIADIQSRRKHPQIESKLILHTGNIEPILFWKVLNTGNVMARHWKIVIEFPTHINGKGIHFKEAHCIHTNNPAGSFWELRISNSLGSPLFPGSNVSGSFDFKSVTLRKMEKSISDIKVTIFADEMPAHHQSFSLADVIKIH